MQIRVDDLTSAPIINLLQAHLDDMALHSPPASIHALDLTKLRQPNITFWSVWERDDLMGCGALKALDAEHGEIKSMRTAAAHLRKGVAAKLLQHILDEAKSRGYTRLSLETGSPAVFTPARRLYERFGFTECAPFADYVLDPYSVFMRKTL